MRPKSRSSFLVVTLLLPIFFVFGCGGGGGPKGIVTGVVTDVDGKAVAGADVRVGPVHTTSVSNGSFELHGITDGIQIVHADINIQGHHWSGETAVDAVGHERNRNINVVVSDDRFQGGIAGSVIDSSGFGIRGAKVFVGGPVSSTIAITDGFGNYQVDKLTPGVTYTVTASLAGFTNATKQVHVDASSTSAASFVLDFASSQGQMPAPQNLVSQSWTVADTVTRAASPNKNVYDWLKAVYRKKRGLQNVHQGSKIELKSQTRSTPAGSLIEVDLFWDFQSFNDLFGYAIERGPSQNNTAVVALARDPLTRVFFDLDSFLTPDTTYFYAVRLLDTVDFPSSGALGARSTPVSARPFQPTNTVSPVRGANISGNPTFQWTAVAGANNYTIYLFDRIPDLQSSTDPNGVTNIWTTGNNVVSAPATSKVYDGPALIPGHTYYWMTVASDTANSTMSVTEISKFTKQ